MTRGRCGSLHLQRMKLSFTTPCRFNRRTEKNMTNTKKGLMESESKEFAERIRINQQKLSSELRTKFDYIVVGAGTSGSVVAGRLASDLNTQVLLLEAGGSYE